MPGYALLFADAGVGPDDIHRPEDIRLLPTVGKVLLRDNQKDITATDIPRRQLRQTATSDSSGIPFGFYRLESSASIERAFIHLGWERAGWRARDRSAVLRGERMPSQGIVRREDAPYRELHLPSYDLDSSSYDAYLRRIEGFGAVALQAYPSMAAWLADLILEGGGPGQVGVPFVLLASEDIWPWQLERIQRAFPDAHVSGLYGHSERAVLAPWCEHGRDHRVRPFYGLAEVLGEEDDEVAPGAVGEIVGTSFWGRATPFIRHRTQDLARKGGWGCDRCGRQGLLFQNIESREHDVLVCRTGKHVPIPTHGIHEGLFRNVRELQLFRDSPGRVVLRMIRKRTFTEQGTMAIERLMREKLGSGFELEVVCVPSIPKTPRGKACILDRRPPV